MDRLIDPSPGSARGDAAPWTGDVVLEDLLSGARDERGEELWVGLDPWGSHLLHWPAG